MVLLSDINSPTAINLQAAELLKEVERALNGKQKDTIQVHLEISMPKEATADDVAKILFYYHPRLLPDWEEHRFTDTYDVDLALRVNTSNLPIENQYFIKLLSRRLGLRPLFGPGWEQGTYYGYTRSSTASASFSYEKLVAALRALAELPLAESMTSPNVQHYARNQKLRNELIEYFDMHHPNAYYDNLPDQELYLQAREVTGKIRYELEVLGKKKFILDVTTYDLLTLANSWDEDDWDDYRLSQTSNERFQAGAQYYIMLSELFYLLA